MKYYNRYDLIIFHKLHPNKIFKKLNLKKDVLIPHSQELKEYQNGEFIKSRQGIVISKITNPYNKENPTLIVLPLTTKKFFNKVFQEKFRSEITLKSMKKSYLMWYSIITIDKEQIIGLYYNHEKTIKISGAVKNFLKKEGESKLKNLLK